MPASRHGAMTAKQTAQDPEDYSHFSTPGMKAVQASHIDICSFYLWSQCPKMTRLGHGGR